MKWRKIAAAEVESTIGDPDMQQDSIRGRKNAFKTLGGRLVKSHTAAKVMILLS
jgi:hypothetical protein